MFGQTSSSRPNQWSDQGYSRSNNSKPSVTDSYLPSRPWNQNRPSDSNSTAHDQSWQNDSTYNSRTSSSLFQSSIGLKLESLSNTFSDQSSSSSRTPWLLTTPPPVNRKRPLGLALDEDEYQASSFNSKSDSWPRPRSDEWSRSDTKSKEWPRPDTKSKEWPRPDTKSKEWPRPDDWNNIRSDDWNKPRSDDWNKPRSEDWNKPRSDDWSGSEVKNTGNSWTDNKRPAPWPRSEARPRSNAWSKSNSDPWPRSSDKPYSKFPRIETVQNIPTWSRPRPKKSVEAADVRSVIVTTYYVNQKKVNMPKELTGKFGALNCDLCGVLVNSTITAKTHYTGKTHDKKVSQYMHKWFSERGEPIPEQFKEGVPKKHLPIEEGQTVSFYCGVCDLPLSSKQHAEQHYMGKAHKRALMSGKTPKVPVKQEKPDPTGRFRIGEKFIQSTDPLGLMNPEPLEQSTTNDSNPFFCVLCSVSTTSADQLATHKSGARHNKKLKTAANPITDMSQLPPPAAKGDSILAALSRPNNARVEIIDGTGEKAKDFSIFRTPSGQFYCATCNTTMNSEVQFGQHNSSKKHKLNLNKE